LAKAISIEAQQESFFAPSGLKEESRFLADRFVEPPFTVYDAKQRRWQDRKRAWAAVFGLQSELGRGASANTVGSPLPAGRGYNPAPGGSARPAATLGADGHTVRGGGDARAFHISEWRADHTDDNQPVDTSIFDPVLTETMYVGFCPPGGTILDPFAGGSVRGMVAALLGRKYVGFELRQEQIDANREQWRRVREHQENIGKGTIFDSYRPWPEPDWICADSQMLSVTLSALHPGLLADTIFSCPPYFELEVYSNDPRDLSTMDWAGFQTAYKWIIKQAAQWLRPDAFAVWITGDIRDKKTGIYRNFSYGLTVDAFAEAGLGLYNQAVLLTSISSASLRAPKQYVASRKFVKTHQDILVFAKGDPFKAAKRLSEE